MTGPEASLSDVAARAGVSLATASRVLSDSPHRVAESTRQRVLSAAAGLDFVPNLVARGLVARRTSTLGVIVGDMTDEYFAQIARGIEDTGYARGRATLICNSDRQPKKELAYVRTLRSMRVDAIVFAGSGLGDDDYQAALAPQLALFADSGGVVVRLAPAPGWRADVEWPTSDGYLTAVAHLRSLGHTRIGFVGGPTLLSSSHERLAAAAAAIDAAGIGPMQVFAGDYTREGGVAAARVIMALAADACPTALLAANDQLAIGLLAGLRHLGAKLPGDMSVVGFDDIPSCSFVEPALTTIRVPLYDVGAAGAQLAVDRLAGGAGPRVTLPIDLVVRASTAAPARR